MDNVETIRTDNVYCLYRAGEYERMIANILKYRDIA